MSDSAAIGRAVVLVGGPAAPYSRGLRIARTLDGMGYRVEIAAVVADGVPDHEFDGRIEIRRYRPSGPYARMAPHHRATGGPGSTVADGVIGPGAPTSPGSSGRVGRARRRIRLGLGAVRRWLFWPHTVRGWWATLRTDLAPADLYHACGSLTVAAALEARDRDARQGRRSVVIYDAVDDVASGNNVLDMPGWIRRRVAAREGRWARQADARITVNDALADRLTARWEVAERPLSVPNWPDLPAPSGSGNPVVPDDRIRSRLDLPTSTRIALFEGRLGPNLGLDEAAEAILHVPDAALVLIGFGRGFDAALARDRDPRFKGRHFTLPAVHPDELAVWTGSADVSLIPLPPVSANQRAATPNKFWESIAVGTPVVVGPDLPVMAALVAEHRLGVIADSLAPEPLARAIRSILDRPERERLAERERIRALAAVHFVWAAAAAGYRALVDRTAGRVS